MKLAINTNINSKFALSREACDFLNATYPDSKFSRKSMRDNEDLIECIETLGIRASGDGSHIVIVHVPDDIDWEIHEINGREFVTEYGKVWS